MYSNALQLSDLTILWGRGQYCGNKHMISSWALHKIPSNTYLEAIYTTVLVTLIVHLKETPAIPVIPKEKRG